jgi:hypothetical protein
MDSDPKRKGVTHVPEHLSPLTPVQTEGEDRGEGEQPHARVLRRGEDSASLLAQASRRQRWPHP